MNTRLLLACIASTWFSVELPGQVQPLESGNLVTEAIPEMPARIAERMMQYLNTRSASFEGWDRSATGMLIATRFGETNQFHYVAQPGATRRQLTFFAEPVGSAAMCPSPSNRLFLFTKDAGGGESYQIFKFDLEGGDYALLSDGKSRNGGILWSNKGDQFAFYSTRRNDRDWDIYLSGIRQPKDARRIVEQSGTWAPVDFSPADDKLLLIHYVSANESSYHSLALSGGGLTQINPTDEIIAYGAARWSKDGKGVYLTSDEDSQFKRLKYYDLASKRFEDLTAEIAWDVGVVELSPKGEVLAFVANENGIDRLYLMDTRSKRYNKVANIPVGQIGGLEFHPDGKRLSVVINTPQSPGDVYVLELEDRGLTRWTYSEVGGLNNASFVVPQLIAYPTFDKVESGRRTIPAFYYKPEGPGPFPAVIYIHGGPEGQFVPYFSSRIQYWVNELGVAVIAPNVRGSAGYGKKYLKLDNGYKREDSVKDIGALLDWVRAQPELDAGKVAVYGGSYGGYMVLASMIRYNDRLKCGIDVVGISNFVTFLQNTKDYRRDLRRAEYGDERDPEMRAFLEAISPTASAHKITRPMFIAQGKNDPRVPESESRQIVEQVRKNGGQVWYMLAKDEGHGFRKKTSRDYFEQATVLFFETHLLK